MAGTLSRYSGAQQRLGVLQCARRGRTGPSHRDRPGGSRSGIPAGHRGPKIGSTTNSVDASSVSRTLVTDCSVTIVIRVLSSRVTCAVGSNDASTAASRSCSDCVRGVEPPGPVAAFPDLGEYPPMRRDVGVGQSRRSPDGASRRSPPRHARPSPPVRTAARSGSAGRPRARHRCRGLRRRRWSSAARPILDIEQPAPRVPRSKLSVSRPAVQQRELRPQPVHQPEQSAAQRVAAIVATGHPAAAFEFGQHQRARRGADPADAWPVRPMSGRPVNPTAPQAHPSRGRWAATSPAARGWRPC